LNALHYLLKPFGPNKLINAVARTSKQRESNDSLISKLEQSGLLSYSPNTNRIGFSTSEGIEVINVDKIVRVRGDGPYTEVFVNTGQTLIVSKSIGVVEEMLSNFQFIRVHTSHLVNLDYVVRYNKSDGGYLELSKGEIVPVSRRKRKNLMSLLRM